MHKHVDVNTFESKAVNAKSGTNNHLDVELDAT